MALPLGRYRIGVQDRYWQHDAAHPPGAQEGSYTAGGCTDAPPRRVGCRRLLCGQRVPGGSGTEDGEFHVGDLPDRGSQERIRGSPGGRKRAAPAARPAAVADAVRSPPEGGRTTSVPPEAAAADRCYAERIEAECPVSGADVKCSVKSRSRTAMTRASMLRAAPCRATRAPTSGEKPTTICMPASNAANSAMC